MAVVVAVFLRLAPGDAEAQVVRQLTDLTRTETSLAGLDDAGTVAFAFSSTDPYGRNPDHEQHLFRWSPSDGTGEQVTTFTGGVLASPYGPSVSDDGTRVAFLSFADPTGENPDRSVELFLLDTTGPGITQVTSAAAPADADIAHYAFAGNGGRVVFATNADYLGTNPSRVGQLFVVEADGTGLRQITAHSADDPWFLWPSMSDDGNRIAYVSGDGIVGGNSWQVFGILHDGTGRRQITTEDYL